MTRLSSFMSHRLAWPIVTLLLLLAVNTAFNAAQTQAINAGWILIFAPVFAALWTVLGKRGRNPGPMVKFGLSLIQVGAGFLILLIGVPSAIYGLSGVHVSGWGVALIGGSLCLIGVALGVVATLIGRGRHF